MSGEENAKKSQQGSPGFIEEICAATWKGLYRFIYCRVQNREEAEDITQETYVRALSHIRDKGVKIEKYSGFLKTVSLNILRDKWRKNRRHGGYMDLDSLSQQETAVEDASETSIQRGLLENALSRLSEEQQKVIELRIVQGYSAAETGRLINKKEGTVRVIQYRALQELAAILGEIGMLEED